MATGGPMDLDLRDKVIVVTGGTDGIGLGLAELLVAEGARVAVCGRDEGRLEAAATRLGHGGLAVQADVTSPADLDRLVDETTARWGRLDGLVNNAGRSMGGPLEHHDEADW